MTDYSHILKALDYALMQAEANEEYYREKCDALTKKLENANAEIERMDKLLKNAVNPGEERNDATVSLY